MNSAGESAPSKIIQLTYHSDRIVEAVSNIKTINKNLSCVTITWALLKNSTVQHYKIQFTDSWKQEQTIEKGPKASSATGNNQ